MITYIAPLPAGNAIQVFLDPPEDASRCRVLRKRADTIATPDDPGANVVFDGLARQFLDYAALVNGTEYFYRPFYLLGDAWVPAPSRAVTPAAEFGDVSPDALDVIQKRLDLGFDVFIKNGSLVHPLKHIPVLLAVPVLENASFPFVSVHMQNLGPAERFIGESLGAEQLVGIGDDAEWSTAEGWLSRYQILVVVWSQNGDMRNAMRKALTTIVTLNLPILEAAGLSLIEPNFSDIDDMNTYDAPMYQTVCTLACVAPTAVETKAPVARDVQADFYPS